MKKLLTIIISFMPFLAGAQAGVGGNVGAIAENSNDFMISNTGGRVALKPAYEYTGSPFFGENFCHADIQIRKGKFYKGIKLKVNLQDNAVIYIDSSGKEMEAVSAIDMIRFYDCADASKNKTLISGLPKIDKQDELSFYIVLAPGTTALLKHIEVTYYDRQNNYGSASIIRSFKQNETYYTYSEKGGIVKLDKDNETVLKQLDSSKEKQISTFMAQNSLKLKKEKDLVKLFEYYNSLP